MGRQLAGVFGANLRRGHLGAEAAAGAACELTRKGGELSAGGATGPAIAAAGAGVVVVTRITGAGLAAGTAAGGAGADVRWLGGGAMAGGGATAAGRLQPACFSPSCCRMIWLTSIELSAPQFWQTKWMGEFRHLRRDVKRILRAAWHWIFMAIGAWD